jgi:hypothetical protein
LEKGLRNRVSRRGIAHKILIQPGAVMNMSVKTAYDFPQAKKIVSPLAIETTGSLPPYVKQSNEDVQFQRRKFMKVSYRVTD